MHPDRFDVEVGRRFGQIDDDSTFTLNLIIYLERLLAHGAFEDARSSGKAVLSEAGLDRSECLDDLTTFYSAYGLSSGTHQTEQLVRGIESQAFAQAAVRPR